MDGVARVQDRCTLLIESLLLRSSERLFNDLVGSIDAVSFDGTVRVSDVLLEMVSVIESRLDGDTMESEASWLGEFVCVAAKCDNDCEADRITALRVKVEVSCPFVSVGDGRRARVMLAVMPAPDSDKVELRRFPRDSESEAVLLCTSLPVRGNSSETVFDDASCDFDLDRVGRGCVSVGKTSMLSDNMIVIADNVNDAAEWECVSLADCERFCNENVLLDTVLEEDKDDVGSAVAASDDMECDDECETLRLNSKAENDRVAVAV